MQNLDWFTKISFHQFPSRVSSNRIPVRLKFHGLTYFLLDPQLPMIVYMIYIVYINIVFILIISFYRTVPSAISDKAAMR